MIAKVFPIRRLPAHAGPYDYIAPEGIQPGDLVEITFKGRPMLGVVWALEDRSDLPRVENIQGVVEKNFLEPEDRLRFDSLALITVQSVASYLALLPLGKTKGAPKIKALLPNPGGTYTKEDILFAKENKGIDTIIDSAHQWPLHILAHLRAKGQHLIICPNEDIAKYIESTLRKNVSTLLIRGAMRFEEERKAFEAWRAGTQRVLIATRHAILWPARHLASVIIIDDASPDYEFVPRNPRYDARFAGYLLSAQHDIPLYRIGHAAELPYGQKAVRNPSSKQEVSNATILDARKHPVEAPYLSLPILDAVRKTTAEGKNTVFFLNKKGVATHFQCRACGHLPTCGTCGAIPIIRKDDLICPACHTEMWHPETCPECGKKTLTKKGIGIEHVKSSLEKIFPENKYLVISEIGMRQIEIQPDKSIGLFVDLCADYHFLDDSYACEEKGRHKLMRFLHAAKDHRARVVVQTHQPERIRTLLQNEWDQKELKIRKKYKLPPYSIEIQIQPKDGKKETLRPIDRTTLLEYLTTFRSLGRKDTIEIHPQITAYERITSSK